MSGFVATALSGLGPGFFLLDVLGLSVDAVGPCSWGSDQDNRHLSVRYSLTADTSSMCPLFLSKDKATSNGHVIAGFVRYLKIKIHQ